VRRIANSDQKTGCRKFITRRYEVGLLPKSTFMYDGSARPRRAAMRGGLRTQSQDFISSLVLVVARSGCTQWRGAAWLFSQAKSFCLRRKILHRARGALERVQSPKTRPCALRASHRAILVRESRATLLCALGMGVPFGFDQFFWTMQLAPAALRLEHNSLACSAETKGPTMAR
jgi:hypothetical protein